MLGDFPIIIGESRKLSSDFIDIINPYNDEIIARQSIASEKDAESVLENIGKAFLKAGSLSILERKEVLLKIIEGINSKFDEIAGIISLEAGKPIIDSRVEVSRAINVFKHSLSICEHSKGEIIDLSSNPGANNYTGYIHYVPIGPILAITPFNFPFNLTAHKIAPAIAAGCPVIHRPSSKTPISGYYLANIITEAQGLPYCYNFLPCKRTIVDKIINSGKIKKLSFTGSPSVGWELKKKANKIKTTLELGGNASCIVSSDVDLTKVINKCIKGAYSYSGQVCISIQKLHIHQDIYEEFSTRFVNEAKNLKAGDPIDKSTNIGPIIDRANIERINDFINDALRKGARLLLAPVSNKNIITPFIFENTNDQMLIETEELFGPGVIFHKYSDLRDTVNIINSSKYGLQAGIFSNNIKEINFVFDNIDIGALVVNDIPTFRADSMPYGGVRESGFGREGISYALKEMLEPKLMLINKN